MGNIAYICGIIIPIDIHVGIATTGNNPTSSYLPV